MRIAVIQIDCRVGEVQSNIQRARTWCDRAASGGADLLVLPEMVDTGYAMGAIRAHARSWDEGIVPVLRTLARERSLCIIAGLGERTGAAIFNTQVFVATGGEVLAKYRKTHLFNTPPAAEDTCFTAGGELVAVDHAPFRFGLAICYDLRFPELYRTLAVKRGVTVFVTSAAWPFPRTRHLRTLVKARAIENQSYHVLANRVGCDEGVTCCGSSVVIDPYGVELCSGAEDREEILFAEISPEVVAETRARMPVFADRRVDLYG